jgi:hypothetical protein
MISFRRTIRTPTSERFVAVRDGREVAAVDLHYLEGGTVSGTVVLFREPAAPDGGWSPAQIPDLLAALDEEFLPDVDLAHGNLNYTVVLADVLGNYEATAPDAFNHTSPTGR